jgi:hypothetical protein
MLRGMQVNIALPSYVTAGDKPKAGLLAIQEALTACGARVSVVDLPVACSFLEALTAAGNDLSKLPAPAVSAGPERAPADVFSGGVTLIPSSDPLKKQLRTIGNILEKNNSAEILVQLPSGGLGQVQKIGDRWTAVEFGGWEGVAAEISEWAVSSSESQKGVSVSSSVDGTTVKAMIQTRSFRGIPVVRQIAPPPLVRADYSFFWDEGYDSESEFWSDSQMMEPEWSGRRVTRQEMEEARSRILAWFDEFPFVKQSSRADCVAAALTPWFARANPMAAIPGVMIHAVEQNSGKTQLARLISMTTTGYAPLAIPSSELPTDENEIKKTVVSLLIEADKPVYLWDNIKHSISSAFLEGMHTSREVTARILGQSKTVRVQNNTLWLYTMNEATASEDMLRRLVVIKLDTSVGSTRPWSGNVLNRAEMLSEMIRDDLALLVSWWVQQGSPEGSVNFQTYEDWSQTISGILETCGIEGMFETREDALGEVYTPKSDEEILFERIANVMGTGAEWRVKDFTDYVTNMMHQSNSDCAELKQWLGSGDTRSAGRKLSAYAGRTRGPWKLVRHEKAARAMWYTMAALNEEAERFGDRNKEPEFQM